MILGLVAYLLVGTALLVFAGLRVSHMLKRRSEYLQSIQKKSYAQHIGPVARLDELKGSGRVYLVQVGAHKDPYSLDDLANWLHTKYALDARVLPPANSDTSTWDSHRSQFIAEALYDQIKRDHPDLAADPDAYLIGFTDADMYSVRYLWRSTFTQRDLERAAIISSNGMQDSQWEQQHEDAATAKQHFDARLRRILLKDVAILYWRLDTNSDRSSLLHNTLDPDLPAEDIYESDLDPARAPGGHTVDEPCIFFDYSAGKGIEPLRGSLIRDCADVPDPEDDTSRETFELDLRLGLLIDKRTDFYLPDTIPIQFQRATRDAWKGVNPFGISGNDNYDEFLASADNIQVSVIHADGGSAVLEREPRWLPVLSLVKYVNPRNPGFWEMRWHSSPFEHYDLKRFDGAVRTYLPCDSSTVRCYLTDYRDSQGRELKFERGEHRRLMRLTSPNQSWLRLDYDSAGRIADVADFHGRVVRYSYDGANRLIGVTYPSGEVCHYEYDGSQHLLTFSTAPDARTSPRVWMRNEYSNGLLVKQTLADGRVYSYSYQPANAKQISSATVQSADGKTFNLRMNERFSTIYEQPAPRK